MIVRIEIDPEDSGHYSYRVTHEADPLYDDSGLESLTEALVAAIEGLAPETLGVELAYGGIISGTYPLDVLALNHEQLAEHALNTTAAMQQALARTRR